MKFYNFNINLVVKKLRNSYIEESNSFNAFKYNEIKYIIPSHFVTSENISPTSREIFIDALLGKFHSDIITKENFKGFFETLRKEYFAKRETKYTLLTTLSIDYLPFRKIKINNSTISITGKTFPLKFVKSRKEKLDKFHVIDEDNRFLRISVETKGKNSLDAFEQAYFDLNIFRANLCLYLNSTSEIPLSNDSNRSINRIQFGEYHTIHPSDVDLDLEISNYWFETSVKNKLTYFPMDYKSIFTEIIKSNVKRFNNCYKNHRLKLGRVYNLYVRAFDEKISRRVFSKVGWLWKLC